MKYILLILFIAPFYSFSQENVKKVFRQDYSLYNSLRNDRINNFLLSHKDFKTKFVGSNGVYYALTDVSTNGIPIYNCTFNTSSAKSARINFLQEGGDLNLNLTGKDMYVGVWDGGVAFDQHNEFKIGKFGSSSRVIIKDESAEFDSHATHVTGTIAAKGAVTSSNNPNSEAKGMATEVGIVSYDWDNFLSELEDDMSDSSYSSNGLLVSNHSWGIPIFSDNGTFIESLKSEIGGYNSRSRLVDELLFENKYHLFINAGGNDGDRSYEGALVSNGDKFIGFASSKNTLTVANANGPTVDSFGNLNSLTVHSSSSQGPIDDGRIKPDLAANGQIVLSSNFVDISSKSVYDTKSGTSMAAPVISGAAILIQEHYFAEFNKYLKSSSLKGLLLHTADDDFLNEGPDYKLGWGLINAKAAVDLINTSDTTSKLDELSLSNGDSYESSINVLSSGDNLKVSLSWNDPQGIIKTEHNDPTPSLVNDLDLRVFKDGVEYFPWKLDLSNLSGGAIKGDNKVDNFEQVLIENAEAGSYVIKVSHKGTLTNSFQDFTLLASGDTALSNKDFKFDNLVVFPNPSKNYVDIQFSDKYSQLSFALFDINGRKILDSTLSNYSKLDLSSYSRGLYTLRISDGIDIQLIKIIKE